ncbi:MULTISPECIES: DUF421 domain-containing protein [unclassified Aureispira]|uniref:DUF421 domain-containing protein n=1 Tax=unclassified Aureispira TaxID=2649989 RepID=UPI000696D353|nr:MULTISPECIES: YetF domain-containing protein [unclassified Aureispira]WMX13789.1 DUF421 domain-containing protein [Aureispira sp. CCB-E]
METIFSTQPVDILRILISSAIIYALIIIYIRLLGKRSTSELNNFDWVVTVSIGSIVASTIILKDISVTEGGLAVLILLILQYILTKMMFSSDQLREVVKSTPQLLLFEGKFIDENMKKERILKPEIYAAIRQKGLKSIQQIYAIVLETNSKLSIIPNENSDEIGFSLSDVQGLPEGLKKDLEEKANAPT